MKLNDIFKNSPIIVLLMTLILFGCSQKGSNEVDNSGNRPNIIIILADDMGYSDLGCTGGEIETPNIDSLAHHGVLFTNIYNASKCCPSRASLLTGLYHHEAGMGAMVEDNNYPPSYVGYLNDKCITIAEALKEAGYSTLMTGKWHVGNSEQNWPQRRGFDRYYGSPIGGGYYFYPPKYVDRNIFLNDTLMHPDKDFYSTDAFTDYAINFIRDAKRENDKKPFFLYLAYTAPHYPLQAKNEDIVKYEGKYSVGYDSIRNRRFRKQKRLGIVNLKVKLSPSDFSTTWDKVKNKEEEATKMSVYAAMIDCMDQNVGKLMTALRRMGIDKNTIVLFLSDNGAVRTEVDLAPNEEIGTASSFASYGRSWANVSNTPYKNYKGYTEEGGIITPLIVYWPIGIKEKGRIDKTPGYFVDIMPTCLDLANATYPAFYKGKKRFPLEGISLLSDVKSNNSSSSDQRVHYWEYRGSCAVRKGNWKLVKQRYDKQWSLYNLSKDPTELNNLSHKDITVFKDLLHLYKIWEDKVHVKKI